MNTPGPIQGLYTGGSLYLEHRPLATYFAPLPDPTEIKSASSRVVTQLPSEFGRERPNPVFATSQGDSNYSQRYQETLWARLN